MFFFTMGTVPLWQPHEWICMNLCGLLVTRLEVDLGGVTLGGSHTLHVVHADHTLSTPTTRARIPVSSDSSTPGVPFAFCCPRGSEVLLGGRRGSQVLSA